MGVFAKTVEARAPGGVSWKDLIPFPPLAKRLYLLRDLGEDSHYPLLELEKLPVRSINGISPSAFASSLSLVHDVGDETLDV
jgi:hypothetical protein